MWLFVEIAPLLTSGAKMVDVSHTKAPKMAASLTLTFALNGQERWTAIVQIKQFGWV